MADKLKEHIKRAATAADPFKPTKPQTWDEFVKQFKSESSKDDEKSAKEKFDEHIKRAASTAESFKPEKPQTWEEFKKQFKFDTEKKEDKTKESKQASVPYSNEELDRQAASIVSNIEMSKKNVPYKEGMGESEPTPEQTKSLKDSVKTALEGSKGDPEKAELSWDSLRKSIIDAEQEILDTSRTELESIQKKGDAQKERAKLGSIFTQLINAAALLYAAKKGIQSDIKLADPSNVERLREIERDMEYQRNLLKDKIAIMRKRDYELADLREKEFLGKEGAKASAARSAEEKAETARKEALAREKEDRSRREALKREIRSASSKELDKLIKSYGDGDNEAITEHLMSVHKINENKAKILSGQAATPDETPDWNEINKIIQNSYIKNYGIGTSAPAQEEVSTDSEYVYMIPKGKDQSEAVKVHKTNINQALKMGFTYR